MPRYVELLKGEEELKEQMMTEAMLIINSVAFLEAQINQAFGELQEAVNNHFYDDVDRINKQIEFLVKKTNEENRHMDDFLVRFGDIINEKKTILSGIKQKKQIHDGRVSTNQTGPSGCIALQRRPQKEKQRFAVDNKMN